MPRLPLAPVLFSTTTCWPSTRARCWPTSRAAMSVEPPAANGTITWIGRFGHCWASVVKRSSRTKPQVPRGIRMIVIAAPFSHSTKQRLNSRSGALRNIADIEQAFRQRPRSASSRTARSGRSRTTRARPPSRLRRRSNALRRSPRTGARGDSFNSRPRPAPAASARTDTSSTRCGCRPHASCPRSRSARPWRAAAPPRPAPARLRSSPPACCRSGKAAPDTAPFRAGAVPSASAISEGGTRSS